MLNAHSGNQTHCFYLREVEEITAAHGGRIEIIMKDGSSHVCDSVSFQ